MSEESLFHAALAKPAGERPAFLDGACLGQPALRAAIDALLAAHEQAVGFPDQTAAQIGATAYDAISHGPGSVIGPYKLLQKIGEGGFGIVFMADQTHPVRRQVALKIIKPGMDTAQVIARFESERQALALMDHPHIAKVLDAGATGGEPGRAVSGRPYFVMELVKGVPITEFCDRNHMPARRRLKLFIDVCHAIQHAHQKGVIHRDIKPSNVMVTLHDGVPVVKVIDFGVAKATAQKLTEKTLFTAYGQMIGTPAYMSPEQAEMSGLDIDTRSDVYSLGVLLYELLTGTTPLESKRLREAGYAEMQRLICEEEAPRPSNRLSSLGASATVLADKRGTDVKRLTQLLRSDLDWIVMKALEKDRTRRYETASGFARDLQRYLLDEPVEACPPSTAYRLRKFANKHRTVLATAAMVFILLAGGIAISSWQAVRATAAERELRLALYETQQAKTKTETALRESDHARRQSEAVTSYLAKLFRSPDPRVDGRDVKLADLLDRAPAEIEAVFPDSPETQSELLATIAGTYEGLRLFANSAAVYEKLVRLRRETLPPEHPDTLDAMRHLAACYRATGRAAEAVVLAKEVLDRQLAKLGVDDPQTLVTSAVLGDAYQTAGRAKEAIQILEPSLKLCKARLGIDDYTTLLTMNSLALAYQLGGRLPEAVALFQDALARHVAKLGPDHPETLVVTNNLAEALRYAGQPAETVRLLEPALRLCQTKLGTSHPTTLTAMNNLALGYQATGRLPQAVRLLKETHQAATAKLGPDHSDTLTFAVNLAVAHLAGNQPDLALPLFKSALPSCRAKLGVDHRVTQACARLLAEAYEIVNQPDQAEALRHEFVEALRKNPGPQSSEFAGALALLGRNYLLQKQFAKSEAVVRECLAVRQVLQPDSWVTFNTQSLLGATLLGQKRYAEAEPLLLKGYEGMKQREATIPVPAREPRLREGLERLVELYQSDNRPEEAGRWKTELEALSAVTKPVVKP